MNTTQKGDEYEKKIYDILVAADFASQGEIFTEYLLSGLYPKLRCHLGVKYPVMKSDVL